MSRAKFNTALARLDATAVGAHVHFDQHVQRHARLAHGLREIRHVAGIVHAHAYVRLAG